MSSAMANIHPGAKIGANVTIEPFATVYGDVEIGDGTWVAPGAVIMDGARIGKNCKIFPGAVIAGIPQDLKFKGEKTTVEIGDNTTIRECVTVNRGTAAKGKTVIGSNSLIMAYAHVAHDCLIGNFCIVVNSVGLAGEVEIGDWAIVGGGSLVHQFVRIGEHAMISGGSKIGKDVPPFSKAGHEPLTFAGVNLIGLRRRNFTPKLIEEIHEVYRYVYLRGMNRTMGVQAAEANVPQSEERDLILNFIKASKRGIIKGPGVQGVQDVD
jgi:UDP-N-acetylglucosamine acyltransferase